MLAHFYSRPCGRGDSTEVMRIPRLKVISTHAPAGGATRSWWAMIWQRHSFLLTPLREGRPRRNAMYRAQSVYFYSRPCGRGDEADVCGRNAVIISTHAPAGGATQARHSGRRKWYHFYSRPCGRGDWRDVSRQAGFHKISTHAPAGGATRAGEAGRSRKGISTHAPAGGATRSPSRMNTIRQEFLLTPLREGRQFLRLYFWWT